jgi:hypothetical protein
MTTFEEISTCPKANFDYWTAQAKMNLTFARVNKRIKHHPFYMISVNSYKNSFKKCMASRRNQEFLN